MDNSNVLITDMSITFSKVKRAIYLLVKRIIDIIVALVGIILMIPAILFIKIASICTGDFKSIFYSQDRIGKDGKTFKLYKFRSMVPNADEILMKALAEDKKLAKEYNKSKKLKNDPRITKMGKILRRTSLDELPQLINILKGEMSVIGNRPYLPREKKDMGEYFDEIVKTKPGLTGYWQVAGKKDTTFERRLILEQYYSNNMSLKLDIKIFFKTFKAVIGGHGADE